MDARDLICRQNERQIDSLFRAARALRTEKLTWKPAPGARSALDQLQEIATSYTEFADAYRKRKVEWNPKEFARWMQERSQYTDLDELERMTREGNAKLAEEIRATDLADLSLPVEMPFPGDFTVADIFSYYSWNAAYHEGQIYYIGSLDSNAG